MLCMITAAGREVVRKGKIESNINYIMFISKKHEGVLFTYIEKIPL